ncbi:MAG: hypothetical protein ACTIKR_00900 [Advenella sp.]|uniref:Uncharacterized protein n=1 Tax=Advenella kashmirensis TaxID=310575 RepID=A0A356LAT5_9BURK|nr:hypothetical protein [Advenella sp. FME57]HBP28034.1 hypothetical protein [Advenella kashmirensis]
MNYKTFYRLSLSVPVLVPLLFYLLSLSNAPDKFSNLLMASLTFGGIQYLFFAAVMVYLIGRLGSLREIKILFWCSPLIYIIFATIGWHVFDAWMYLKSMKQMSVDDVFGPLLFFSIFGSLFGYIYCLIIEMLFQIFKAHGGIAKDS